MGKAARNEMKRAAVQYLNGIAVAVMAAGCIGPIAFGSPAMPTLPIAVAVSVGLVGLARVVASAIED